VIDEIQKVPELLAVIHRLIEENQGYTFVLTRSRARKLKAAASTDHRRCQHRCFP